MAFENVSGERLASDLLLTTVAGAALAAVGVAVSCSEKLLRDKVDHGPGIFKLGASVAAMSVAGLIVGDTLAHNQAR